MVSGNVARKVRAMALHLSPARLGPQWLVYCHGLSICHTDDGSQILTGATGALGANMLDQLVKDDRIESIICLVRAENDHAASERVQHSLLHRAKQVTPQTNKKVVCLAATLAGAQLGLSDEKYHELANVSSMIIHVSLSPSPLSKSAYQCVRE